MTSLRLAVLAAFALAPAARADDAAARAVIDKAIKAHGGEETLAKNPALTMTMQGKVHAMGMEIPFTGEAMSMGPDRLKIDLQLEVMNQKFRVTNVVAKDKGWAKANDAVTELDKDQLAESLEQGHAGWVTTLVPLKDKKFTLSLLGEAEVEKKPAIGVKVAYPGRRDVDLYFDKETHLLVKREARAKDEGGQEVNEEAVYSGYREVRGVQQPAKVVVKRDGKLFVEAEVTDAVLAEKFPDGTFVKP
ncbi:MAG: hypothetical protein K2P78_02375 [Gemmataceae bacterium]|nr:hypothetical protein [Gemmataceae bacterium]